MTTFEVRNKHTNKKKEKKKTKYSFNKMKMKRRFIKLIEMEKKTKETLIFIPLCV